MPPYIQDLLSAWTDLWNVHATDLLVFTGIFFSLGGAYVHARAKAGRAPLPPGPPTLPVIGNLWRVRLARGAWHQLTRYKEEFGKIVFLHGLGTNVLVLNTLDAVNDLLDKRGTIYSHRPIFTVVGELMNLNKSLALIPYGKEWREHRKLANTVLGPHSVMRYRSAQEGFSALLCKSFLESPEMFFDHTRLAASRIVMIVTYGFSAKVADDVYITHAERTMELITKATVPGAYLADSLPILKYSPKWVPFQREAVVGREMIDTLITRPFEHVKSQMVNGVHSSSLAHDMLEKSTNEENESRIKWVTGTMYGAGGEVTYATILTFIMAMALHPHVQRATQAEIDRVVGTRMPTLDDRPHLPYLAAVIKETMRWHPAFPLGVARRCGKDDVYDGLFIPKDTIVIPNVWAIALEDNCVYPPTEFHPERFLDSRVSIPDPSTYAFGFGRRFCPGRYLGENSIFALASNIVAAFDIAPPVGDKLAPEFGLDLISYPKQFKCDIRPRSEVWRQVVLERAAQTDL